MLNVLTVDVVCCVIFSFFMIFCGEERYLEDLVFRKMILF
jgi:hypothetical protein